MLLRRSGLFLSFFFFFPYSFFFFFFQDSKDFQSDFSLTFKGAVVRGRTHHGIISSTFQLAISPLSRISDTIIYDFSHKTPLNHCSNILRDWSFLPKTNKYEIILVQSPVCSVQCNIGLSYRP